MVPESPRAGMGFTERERRWLDALLVIGTFAVSLVLVGLLANVFLYFGGIVLVFFLAWLLAFVLSPVAAVLERITPGLPRGLAVLLTYGLLLVALSLLAIYAAQAVSGSISALAANAPSLQKRLLVVIQSNQGSLDRLGIKVDVAAQVQTFLHNLPAVAAPVSSFALAGLGVLGNLLIILFLSLYMVLDRDRILTFGVRLVPPQYAEEFRLFERTVSRSFGGFLRGQAIMGLMYGALAALLGMLLGLPYTPVVGAASGVLQAIPFFGPFLSWAPPVIDAILTQPASVVPTLIVMAAGWLVVMNVVQPRLMADTVGIHPLVVLGSVIVGSKVAGVAGAIFGIPVAAVISSFFFYYLNRATADPRTVAVRAARRVAQREGHGVRVPVPPALHDSLTEIHARADLRPSLDEDPDDEEDPHDPG
ncbi:MAG: AI-2E family transporter [Candidatus Limnocylindrales bacterium]|jgi:predicted PurR-regulated permease PerM